MRRADPDTPRVLRVGEAADLLGVHDSTLRRWADEGRLPAIRFPSGVRRFRADDVEHLRAVMYEEVTQAHDLGVGEVTSVYEVGEATETQELG